MRIARCQCRSISKVCTQCFTKVEMLPLLWIIMDIILLILWIGLSHNLWSSYSISTALLLLLHQVQSPGQTYLQRVLQDLCVRLGRGHARRRLQGRAGISHVVPLEKKKKRKQFLWLSASACFTSLSCAVQDTSSQPGPPTSLWLRCKLGGKLPKACDATRSWCCLHVLSENNQIFDYSR